MRKLTSAFLHSSHWRIVIPNLQEYTSVGSSELQELKHLILERLKGRPQGPRSNIKSEFQRGLRYYTIALERHSNGVPHLDILLVYQKSIQRRLTDYNYLYKPAHVSTYRYLNRAIIEYGRKEDKQSLSNFPENLDEVFSIQELKRDSYAYLYDRMKEDPLRFNLEEYVQRNNLSKDVSNWSSIKVKLKDMQLAAANMLLRQKPGFKFITQELIKENLNEKEYALFHGKWNGYRRIVSYMNSMITQRGARDPKSLNLLLSGPPNCGKSALVWHPAPHGHFNPISRYCSVYPIGMSQWFPKYHSDVYHCIYWNQAKLTSYSYDTILKLLDGSPLDLPNKGSVSRKVDNPLIIMTSNMSLEDMITQKFGYSKDYLKMARKNLAVRVQNVIVPEGYDLFLLQKLLVARS